MKRLGWLAFAAMLLTGGAHAGSPVAVCGLSGTIYQNDCIRPDSNGAVPVTGSFSSGGTSTAAAPTYVEGATGQPLSLDLSGNLRSILPSTQVITTGTAGVASSQVLTVQGVASMTPVQVTETPLTAGGLSVYFVQPTASDNHVVIKAGAGQVYKITVTNNSATVNYLRLYNATTGFNGCNSATNLQYQVAIPASVTVGGIADSWDSGMSFATGISICVTSGYATNDVTNATASAMSVNIGYK